MPGWIAALPQTRLDYCLVLRPVFLYLADIIFVFCTCSPAPGDDLIFLASCANWVDDEA